MTPPAAQEGLQKNTEAGKLTLALHLHKLHVLLPLQANSGPTPTQTACSPPAAASPQPYIYTNCMFSSRYSITPTLHLHKLHVLLPLQHHPNPTPTQTACSPPATG
uniref:Uncharacterized protein n=1 Tax=Knipowitschia caucasica TaxID=637954 RepID=A0AAV2IXP9_KNICA